MNKFFRLPILPNLRNAMDSENKYLDEVFVILSHT